MGFFPLNLALKYVRLL